MRALSSVIGLGFLVFSSVVLAQVPAAVPAQGPLLSPEVLTVPMEIDETRAIASRAQALSRIASELAVREEAITPATCQARVAKALEDGAYQVFVARQGQVPALVPLLFDVNLRHQMDAVRLAPACQVATGLVVTKFSEKVRYAKDERTQRDYIIALLMADWAQSKADGTGLVGREIPADVSADPFNVIARLSASPVRK